MRDEVERLRHKIHEKIRALPHPKADGMGFNREHIFHAILAYAFVHERTTAKLDSIFLYQLFQKALHQLRADNRHTADWFIEKIQARLKKISFASTVSEEGFHVLQYPFLAYVHYKSAEFDEAERWIKKSLNSIDCIAKNGFDEVEALLARLEQGYNLLKIYRRKDEEAACFDQTIQIINMLYTTEVLSKKTTRAEYIYLIKHFSDKVLIEWFKPEGSRRDFTALISELKALQYVPNQSDYLRDFISLFFADAGFDAIDPIDLSDVPFIYQYLLFQQYFEDDAITTDYLSTFPAYKRLKSVA